MLLKCDGAHEIELSSLDDRERETIRSFEIVSGHLMFIGLGNLFTESVI